MTKLLRFTLCGLLVLISASIGPSLHSQAGLSIGGYQLVSSTRISRTVTQFTYRAALTNGGPNIASALAMVTSLSPATTVVDATLSFGPVTTGNSVLSTDTFSVRHNRTVPFSFANLQWSITPQAGNAAPTANAGPDQKISGVGVQVTLNGSLSTDPEGSALTYDWVLTKPAGSSASLSPTSSVAMPTFTPDKKGTYQAQLRVSDGVLTSPPDTVQIVVANTPPIANAGPSQTLPVGTRVTLNGGGSTDADGDPLTYSWQFQSVPANSGATLIDPTAIDPKFDIDLPGSYVVRLRVNDGTANSAFAFVTISTQNSAPVANAGPDQTIFVQQPVSLNGTASTDIDGDILQFSWQVELKPAGSNPVLQNPASGTPTLTVDKPGFYRIRLVVNDGALTSAPDFVDLTTTNSRPTANAGLDQTVAVGNLVTLDGSGSTDVDGQSLTYSWALLSVPTGSTAKLVNPNQAIATFTVDRAGTFVAQLTVSDGSLSHSDTVTISTSNSTPIANAGPDQPAVPGTPVQLDGSASSDPDGNSLTFAWSITSVPAGSAIVPGSSALTGANTAFASFVPDVPGMFIVQLTVNDGVSSSAPDTVMISSSNKPPIANAGPDQLAVVVGSPVTLFGGGSSDPDGHDVIFKWSLLSKPLGSAAALDDLTSISPAFTADRPGQYIAQLIVNDGFVDSAPDTVVIQTANRAPVADAGLDQNVGVGVQVTLDGSGSSDPDGNPFTRQWAFTSVPAGSAATLAGATTASPTFTADLAGAYIVELTVTDNGGLSDSDTVLVTATAAPLPQVSVTASDASAAETGPNSGAFQFTRSGPTTAPLTINFGVGGSATNGVDYTPSLTGSVTIPAGSASASVAVNPVDDNGFEGPETVVVTIAANAAYVIVAPTSATVTIADNDRPTVTVSATDSAAAEAGANSGTFTFARTGITTDPLTVLYTVNGSATNGTDYAPTLPGTIVIPAGMSSATHVITPGDDGDFEGNETASVTLSVNAAYIVGTPSQATITIADNDLPTVTVNATDAAASETGPDTGTFTFSRTGSTASALTVTYSVNGTATSVSDYSALSGSISILAGQASATVLVTPVNDPAFEGDETVRVTITPNAAYAVGSPNNATVTIADNDVPQVTVQATDAAASEAGPDPGTFTFTRIGSTASALSVSYTLNGTAVAADYTPALSGTVTIPSGQLSTTIVITPVDDPTLEGSETLRLTVTTNAAYSVTPPGNATITIADNEVPVVTISAVDNAASEVGPDAGTIRFSRNGPTSAPLVVSFTINGSASNGTDYATIASPITIATGQTSFDLAITPIGDSAPEGTETVSLTVTNQPHYDPAAQPTAVVNIADSSPTVTVAATDNVAGEDGPDTGTFTFTRSLGTGILTAPLTVNFTVNGTATSGVDYTAIGTSVTIPGGQASATVTVTPLADPLDENLETVTVNLAAGAYVIGSPSSATVSIADSDLPIVTIQATDANAAEPGADPGTFRFTRTGSTSAPLSVTYTVRQAAGDAINNGSTDFTPFLGGEVTILAGQSFRDVTVTPANDPLVEGNETIHVTLADGALYNLGADIVATVTIADQPIPVITVTAPDGAASEVGPDTGTLRFTRVGNTQFPLSVSYTVATGPGQATNNGSTDFTPLLNGEVTILAGQSFREVTITPANDAVLEGNETVQVTLADGAQYNLGADVTATVTIADQVIPVVTVTAPDSAASEAGPNTGTLRFTRVGNTQFALDVNYTVRQAAGDATNNGATDFTPFLNGQVTILAGQTSRDVTVTPVTDALVEGNETIHVTLADGTHYNLGADTIATVTISENTPPVITVAATVGSAVEGGAPGTITFSRTGSTAASLQVFYNHTGSTATINTDFSTTGQDFGGQVTFLAGQSTKTLSVTAVQDVPNDPNETVVVNIAPGPASGSGVYTIGAAPNNTATVTIVDTTVPLIGVSSAGDPTATEGGDNGTFTFTRAGGNTAAALEVFFSVSGTATYNTDYTLGGMIFFGAVRFDAGQLTKTVTLTAIQDVPTDGGEVATLTLQPGPTSGAGVYVIDLASDDASVTIADFAAPVIRFIAGDGSATEGGDTGTFVFSRSGGNTAAALEVFFSVSGTATYNTDYTLGGMIFFGAVRFDAGELTKTVTLTAIQDVPTDGGEVATLTLQPGPTSGAGVYAIDLANDDASVTIADFAAPVIRFVAGDGSATEGGDTGTFVFSRSGGNTAAALPVFFAISGTATLSTDYNLSGLDFLGQVTFAAGQLTKTVTLTAVQDVPNDGGEVATLTITGGPASGANVYSIDAANDDASVTIVNFAAPVISFVTGDGSATEGGDTGTFVFSRSGGNTAAALPVFFAISGTATLSTDYNLSGLDFLGQVTFAAGQLTKTVTLTAIQDALDDGGEVATLTITAGPVSGANVYAIDAANDDASVTIVNTAPPDDMTGATTVANAVEDGASGTITATRDGGATGAPLIVFYTDTGTTAPGSDYGTTGQDFSGQITFAAGQLSKTLTVTAAVDPPDPGESVVVNLAPGPASGASVYAIGGSNTATVTIVN
jgi:hypothetical protein